MISEPLKRTVIDLVRGALAEGKTELDNSVNLADVADIANEHQISSLIYYSAAKSRIDKNSDFMQSLFPLVCAQLVLSEKQLYESEKIFEAFRKNNIDFLPLKGAVMKKIYPRPEMRHMSDIDVLIKQAQYAKIESVMQGMGYEFQYESDHELVWKKDIVTVELHKRIMTSYNADFYRYFGDGWQFAIQGNGTEFYFSDEDFFVYLFAHFAKHYRISGIGIKHLVDIWVYRSAKKNLDEAYISDKLGSLGLLDFYENVLRTLSVWFENRHEDEKTKKITADIFASGEYGNKDVADVSRFIRDAGASGNSGREIKKRIRTVAFPPMAIMKAKHPALAKLPFLLPFFWISRLIYILLFRADDVRAYRCSLRSITDDKIEARRKELEFVGLKFDGKE